MNEFNVKGREFLPSDDGGIGISGKWINKRTGQAINVRSSIIDGDNMIIITDNGQISMDEFSRDYIQTSDDIYNENGQIIGQEKVNYNDYIEQHIQQIEKPNIISKKESNNNVIIKKVFDKLTSYPQVNISIEWDEFPKSQLEMLINYLDINIEDISTYIIKKFVNTNKLSSEIKKILKDKLIENINNTTKNDKEE